MIRIYQIEPLTLNEIIILNEKASHHLIRVLRIDKNENLTIFNGSGGEYLADITEISKRQVTVRLIQFIDKSYESPIHIHLLQGIAKAEKMDFIIQKAVQLGVNTITPLLTERTNMSLNHERQEKKMAHWQGIIENACEQCGRNILPLLHAPITLAKYLADLSQPKENAVEFVLSPDSTQKISHLKEKNFKYLTLLIGPEGGLSQKEIQQSNGKGFISLSLGPRILRTETASIAAISALQCLFGDF